MIIFIRLGFYSNFPVASLTLSGALETHQEGCIQKYRWFLRKFSFLPIELGHESSAVACYHWSQNQIAEIGFPAKLLEPSKIMNWTNKLGDYFLNRAR